MRVIQCVPDVLVAKINYPANLNGKLFGYELKYFNPQNTTQGSTGKYNGNIKEVTWKTASDQVLRQYTYQYDGLSRLKKGIYSEPGASVPQNGFFNETLAYDLVISLLCKEMRKAPQEQHSLLTILPMFIQETGSIPLPTAQRITAGIPMFQETSFPMMIMAI